MKICGKNPKALSLFVMLLAFAVCMTGCGFRKDINDFEKKVESDMKARENFKSGLKPFEEINAPYVAGYTKSMASGHEYLKGRKITIRENGAYLADLGDKVSSATGTIVRYSPDLAKRKDVVDTTMNVRFSGDLKQLLDKIAGYYNISWEFQKDSNTIVFYYMKTKTYTLPLHLSDIEVTSSVSNTSDSEDSNSETGSTTGGTSGTSEQTVTTTVTSKTWDEILNNVKAMITNDGSVVVSRTAGTVTVTESPIVLARIDDYINSLANKMARQVSINVRVYNYRTTDEWSLEAGIKGAFNDGYTSMAFGSTPSFVEAGTGFTATILEGTSSRWKGTQGFFDFLKDKGRVALQTTASGITQNNQPLPVQALRRTGYLASMTTTMNDTQTQTSLEPGQVVSGMSILVTPHIQPDDVINLEYNMTYSVLDSIEKVEASGAMIQTPTISSRSILQRFQVKTNSTIIIAGYANDLKGDNSGLNILGFNFGSNDDKEYVIIVIDVADATIPQYDKGSNG